MTSKNDGSSNNNMIEVEINESKTIQINKQMCEILDYEIAALLKDAFDRIDNFSESNNGNDYVLMNSLYNGIERLMKAVYYFKTGETSKRKHDILGLYNDLGFVSSSQYNETLVTISHPEDSVRYDLGRDGVKQASVSKFESLSPKVLIEHINEFAKATIKSKDKNGNNTSDSFGRYFALENIGKKNADISDYSLTKLVKNTGLDATKDTSGVNNTNMSLEEINGLKLEDYLTPLPTSKMKSRLKQTLCSLLREIFDKFGKHGSTKHEMFWQTHNAICEMERRIAISQ